MRREWPTDIGPVDLMCRDAEDGWLAVEIKRVATIEAVEQLTRYLERIRIDPAMTECAGVLAAQQFKPQAVTLAEARGIRCVEVDLEVLRGERARAHALRTSLNRPVESLRVPAGLRETRTGHGDLPDGPGALARDDDSLVFQVRIHGRGGQGVVTAAGLLSVAAFSEGRHAQAFPTFGSERTGAPVVSFCRIDDAEIRVREPISEPDAVIVQKDPTLLHQVDLFAGLKPDGYLVINSVHGFGKLGLGEFVERFRQERLLTVPATDIAREHLGRPLPNAALLGAFAAVSGIVSPASVAAAIREFAGDVGAANVAAADAYAFVRDEIREAAHA